MNAVTSRRPFQTVANKWSRKLHRWGAIAVALPLLVVIVSGLLLQLKKDFAWLQPPTQAGQGGAPTVSFDVILAAARSVPEARVASWDDVERLDVRPGNGLVKVQARSRWEIQIDTSTGAVLQHAYRRSDLIESLHDGSFFHASARAWVFLPAGVVLLGLWVSGLYLWALPFLVRRREERGPRGPRRGVRIAGGAAAMVVAAGLFAACVARAQEAEAVDGIDLAEEELVAACAFAEAETIFASNSFDGSSSVSSLTDALARMPRGSAAGNG